ncbi:MAG: hydrogenase iron-sulfur subunit [Desulfovibrionaceae bacterium]
MAEKIGVYFDESSIGPIFDYEELVDTVQNKWGTLTPVVKSAKFLASDAGKAMIQADIDAEEIDSVVICGSTPRVDGEFFDFGGKVLVERVNLREQAVYCYQEADGTVPEYDPEEGAPEGLQLMVMDYVNMYVAKMKAATVPDPELPETVKTVLVLGGGWTGLTAALAAANAGSDVVLVEKQAELGGKAATMYKTVPLAYPYQEMQDTGVDKKIAAVMEHDKITVKTGVTLDNLAGQPGNYKATIGGETLDIGAVVLATGWVPMDNAMLAPMGFGSITNMVTTAQFEAMAAEGSITKPSDGQPAKKVAFVLNTNQCEPADLYAPRCVEEPAAEGEEAEEGPKFVDMESARHLAYSKSVNTMVALKQAGYVTEKAADGIAYIFYDSMIVPGIHERFYKAAQDKLGVMLTKADISAIEEDGDGVLVKATNTLFGTDIEVKVDLVVVPTGMVPTTAKSPVMNFQYRQGPAFPDLDLFDGFADSNYICFPYETRRTGVYAAGAVRQPMLMDQAEEDATGAALKAIQCIESVTKGVAVHPRSGDLSYPVFNFTRCTQCKRCTEECPFGALDDDEKGTPQPNYGRCRRCGTCMGACPERVIYFNNYGVGMISDMVRQYKIPDTIEEGGPRILIFACENDAYPALDMAARRGHTWSPYVRIIPVRCLGSMNAIWVKDAMSRGTDGVMLMGCKYGDDYQCHFVKGSEICNRRKENIAESLSQLGIEAERVDQFEISIDDYDKIPGMIEDFMAMVLKLGPNPFKGY